MSGPNIPEPIARGAARAWAAKLNDATFDNGDAMSNVVHGYFQSLSKPPPPIPADQVQRFEDVLTARILSPGTSAHWYEGHVSFGTDYGPGVMLAEVARDADLPADRIDDSLWPIFPIKSHMHVWKAFAQVGWGHGAPYEVCAGEQPPHWRTYFGEGHEWRGKPSPICSVHTESTDNVEWTTTATGVQYLARDRSIDLRSPTLIAHRAELARIQHERMADALKEAFEESGPPPAVPRMRGDKIAFDLAFEKWHTFEKLIAVNFAVRWAREPKNIFGRVQGSPLDE